MRGEKTAEYHEKYAQDRIDQNCLSLTKTALMRKCIHEEIDAAREHDRSEQDLDAQQDMARFTKIMGYAALAGLLLGLGSAVLIYLTLTATRETLKTTIRMANDAREIGIAQTRAYLIPDKKHVIDLEAGKSPKIHVTFKNCGTTPAFDVKFLYNLQMVAPNSTVFRSFKGRISAPSAPQMSGGDFGVNVDGINDLNEEQIYLITSGKMHLLGSGIITYRDIHRVQRRTIFCIHTFISANGGVIKISNAKTGNRAS